MHSHARDQHVDFIQNLIINHIVYKFQISQISTLHVSVMCSESVRTLSMAMLSLGIIVSDTDEAGGVRLSLPNKGHRSDGPIYPIWRRWRDGPEKRARGDLGAWKM